MDGDNPNPIVPDCVIPINSPETGEVVRREVIAEATNATQIEVAAEETHATETEQLKIVPLGLCHAENIHIHEADDGVLEARGTPADDADMGAEGGCEALEADVALQDAETGDGGCDFEAEAEDYQGHAQDDPAFDLEEARFDNAETSMEFQDGEMYHHGDVDRMHENDPIYFVGASFDDDFQSNNQMPVAGEGDAITEEEAHDHQLHEEGGHPQQALPRVCPFHLSPLRRKSPSIFLLFNGRLPVWRRAPTAPSRYLKAHGGLCLDTRTEDLWCA